MQRSLTLNNAALLHLARGTSMPFDHIDAFDRQPPLLGKNSQDFALLPAIFPSDNFDEIVLFNMPSCLWNNFCACHNRFPLLSCFSRLSEHLWCQRDNFHKTFSPQLTWDWAKNACAYRFPSVINDDCSIIVKTDIGAVCTANFLACPYNHSSTHITLFHGAIRQGLFHQHDDTIAHASVASTS